LDIDLRIADLMVRLAEFEDDELEWEIVLPFLRCAYAEGYRQALEEPVRGAMCKNNGYRIPEIK
jgi:hypothetical protein